VHQGDPCASGPECNNTCNEGTQDCLTPLNTPCSDDGNVCTDDVCDGSGTCHVNNTLPCDDGSACTLNDTCTGGSCVGNSMTCGNGMIEGGSCGEECDDAAQNGNGPCTTNCKLVCPPTPQANCRHPLIAHKASLLLKNKTPDKKDVLGWKWVKGAATATADFGAPLTTTGYAICVYDSSANPQPLLFSFVPPGRTCSDKPCWKVTKTTGFKYRDKLLDPDGISAILLKSGAASFAKAQVKGKGALLGMPSLPLTTPVTVQLKRNDNPLCWEATYSNPDKNLSDQFKSKAD
jgi:hypothetical protein